jgi:hypothetical protein
VSRVVRTYQFTFSRLDHGSPTYVQLVAEGETACKAKNASFDLLEEWKRAQGLEASEWRLSLQTLM